MASDDETRRRVFEKLEAWLGAEGARILMAQIPPFRWEELATKVDLERFATKADLERFATKADLERFATKADVDRVWDRLDELRSGLDGVRAEVRAGAESSRAELREGIGGLRVEMGERFDLLAGLTQQTRTMMLVMAGTVASVGALAVALAGLA